MKHIQTIENLFNKAFKEYEKTGVLGEAKINGRMSYGWGNVGELREKYYISISDNVITLRHWGTQTLKINRKDNSITDWYGEGNSDRDSMNTLLYCVGIQSHYFRYGSAMGFIIETV